MWAPLRAAVFFVPGMLAIPVSVAAASDTDACVHMSDKGAGAADQAGRELLQGRIDGYNDM